MSTIAVLKFGGLTLQGRDRFGPDEEGLLAQCRAATSVNEMYRLIEERRNRARAQRLRRICSDYILPLTQVGTMPVVIVSAFDWATDKLQQLAMCVHEQPDEREYARLLMSGELRANTALAMALHCMGCPAYSLTGREAGVLTSPQPVDAVIEHVEGMYLAQLVERGIVPVIAGFQGYYSDQATQREEVSVLGRGGSNLTAVAIAHALGQTECVMLTNVDGLYDKDPNTYADARKLDHIDGQQLLTWEPFPQVIQREAVEYALRCGVDIWIRDGFDASARGTLIACRRPHPSH